MELLPFLVIIGLIATFVILIGLSKSPSPSDSKLDLEVVPAPQQSQSDLEKTAAPFDATTAQPAKSQRTLTGAVYVTDGDTIIIRKTQIRLFGIDAPELEHPYGKKAKWALHQLCKGQTVRAEIKETDAYGRTVAQCFLPDGRDLSAEMVRMGLAIDWPKFSGGKYTAMEASDARKKLFLADARQKGNMFVWRKYEARQAKS